MKLNVDVVIAGGGLAGLGLAKQIKTKMPDSEIIVIEKQLFPRPRAIAKVGESTVEIGSRYLSHTLDLGEYLEQQHLLKFGLRMFFGESASDFSMQDELGPSQTFGMPTYQIDRGDLENYLYDQLMELGVRIIDSASINSLDLEKFSNKMEVSTNGDTYEVQSRWFIDAAGRASILKNKLDLSVTNSHKANAVWFRVDRRIEIDDWTSSTDWRERCKPQGTRWLSTNHLAGPGYWIWVIPLASGVTSVGIVMDNKALEDSAIQCQETAMTWLHKHHSRYAEAIDGANFLDFVVLRDYSYGCKKLFSDTGWAITGESGVFADPFYSPGTDFIAISNDYINDIVCADLSGEDIRFKAALFEKIFKSIYENTLSLYVDQYGGFGDRRMMSLKLLWDQSYYWGVLALLFFQDALTNIDTLRQVNPILQRSQALNKNMQAHFRERASKRIVLPCAEVFVDQFSIPTLKYFNNKMRLENLDLVGLMQELESSTARLEEISERIVDLLQESPSREIDAAESGLFGNLRELLLA